MKTEKVELMIDDTSFIKDSYTQLEIEKMKKSRENVLKFAEEYRKKHKTSK